MSIIPAPIITRGVRCCTGPATKKKKKKGTGVGWVGGGMLSNR